MTIPARADYGQGCYRRSIALEAREGGAHGELADDFHHFASTVRHDGRVVTAVEGEDVRVPWTTCPGATVPLQQMTGAALDARLSELFRHTPARAQCTHLHDVTCLAIAHAGRAARGGDTRRRYDIAVPDRVDRATTCTLARDGSAELSWRVEGTKIVAAEREALLGLRIGSRELRELVSDDPDTERGEAAWVLMRAIFIGLGRQHDFEAMASAGEFASVVGGSCHTYAAERVDQALRVLGSVRDFTSAPDRVLDREPPARPPAGTSRG